MNQKGKNTHRASSLPSSSKQTGPLFQNGAPQIRAWYDRFNAPVTSIDCGQKCAPFNPSGKPFCCDICHAVPAAYKPEWEYLQVSTNLWHLYSETDCTTHEPITSGPEDDLPENMILLACLGPDQCQRDYRAISCRQFPFFPYISSDYRFLGLAYEWHFEEQCWVISHLDQVTDGYRGEFIAFYDDLFNTWMDEMDNYAALSEAMRDQYAARRRRFPLLHRNGGFYLVSPTNERIYRLDATSLPSFGPFYS